MTNDWEKYLDKVSLASAKNKNNKNVNKDTECFKVIRAIDKIAKDHSFTPSARLALIQMLVKDGLDGGDISINTIKKLIGSPSTQTALGILKMLEEREIMVRIRSHLGSKYTFTKHFLDSILQ